MKPEKIPWAEIQTEAIQHFKNLLRLNTANPPGNESLAVEYLADIFQKAGIAYEIVSPQKNRQNIIARLEGGNRQKSLILSSHLDVVPAEEAKWSVDPFGGIEKDGFIWGRGALDMKNMTIYGLMTFLLFKRYALPLHKDLVFAAFADEEAGSRLGSLWVANHRPELLAGEFAFNELGGFTQYIGDQGFFLIQTAEKGILWLKLTASGKSGHGSIPHGENAIDRLISGLNRLFNSPLPRRNTPIMTDFIATLAKFLPFPSSRVFKSIENPLLGDFILHHLLPNRKQANTFSALLHNTLCLTSLDTSSKKENVIPSEASAIIDCRYLPGFTETELIKEIQKRVGPGIQIKVLNSGEPILFSHKTEAFQAICQTLQQTHPEFPVVPYMITGYTDAKAFQQLGITTYGFNPVILPRDFVFTDLIHAEDERIPVDGFKWGVKTFFETVNRIVGRNLFDKKPV